MLCHSVIYLLQKLANLGPGQYSLKSFVDTWDTVHKKRQGKFGKVDQYPEKPTDRVFCSTLPQCPKEPVSIRTNFLDCRNCMPYGCHKTDPCHAELSKICIFQQCKPWIRLIRVYTFCQLSNFSQKYPYLKQMGLAIYSDGGV